MSAVSAGTVYEVYWVNDSPYVLLEARGLAREQRGFFLLDTGANVSAVDRTWAESLLGPVGDRAVIPEFDFGIAQRNAHFLVQELQHLKPIEGQPQVGTLGTDFLSKFALDLVPGEPRLTLLSKEQREGHVGEWLGALRAIPLQLYSDMPPAKGPENIPTVELSLNGQSMPCQLDTGTNTREGETSIAINRAAFERIRDSLKLVEERTLSRTTDETRVQVYESRWEGGLQVAIGGGSLHIQRVIVEGPENGHPFSETTPYALAGMSLIRQWQRVVVDPFGRCLWVKSLAP